MFASHRFSADRGFTLVEVLVAMAIFVAVAAGAAQLFAVAIAATLSARNSTSATILAAAKIEQLRALEWAYEPGAPGDPPTPVSDTETDVSVEPPGSGGPGLTISPAGTLESNASGYVDYLDGDGRWVGNGPEPPRSAAFVRRWAIRPLPDDADQLVLQVLVTTVRQDRARRGGRAGGPIRPIRPIEDALLVTLMTRTAR